MKKKDEQAIKDFITTMYGKRCKKHEEGCPICDEWEIFDEYKLTKKE